VSWGWVAAFVAFVAYAILAAPPDDPALTAALVKGTFTGRFGAVDPAIAAVFAALGVVPALASTLLLRDGARRRIPVWPFALGMFAVGAFALLPWLALRGSFGARPEERSVGALRRLVARPAVGWALLLALTALLAWGLLAGSATAYARAFATTSMVNVMTVDLLVCAGLLMVLVEEARARDGVVRESPLGRAVRFVPVLGTAAWNALTTRDA
jgi:hypothetical protein